MSKTDYLKDLLGKVMEWGYGPKYKYFTSEEISSKLESLGFGYIDSQHIGIFLSRNGAQKNHKWTKKESKASFYGLDILDTHSFDGSKKVKTFRVRFKK